MKKAEILIKDIKDVPFLACALALNAKIWSNDKDFEDKEVDEVNICYFLVRVTI